MTKDLPLKKFEVYEGKELIMQLGLGITLFIPRPFSSVCENVWELWQNYLALAGRDTFTWARLGGGNRSRRVDASTFRTIEAWLTGQKSYGKDCWISIHDGPMDCLGKHSFILEGLGEPNKEEEDVNFIDLGFPVQLLDACTGAELADKLIALVASVPFYCGMAGFIFHRSPYKFDPAIKHMAALSKRFAGVEVTASEREQYWAAKGLVSVNWITFLGDDLVARLGGREAVQKTLPVECVLTPVKHGIAVRTGELPLLGDMNSGKDELGLWRKVYKAFKPIQAKSPYEFDPFEFDERRTLEWLKRLDA